MKPKKGSVINLAIVAYAFEGKGVGRIVDEETGKPFVVFVRSAYPGDVIEARIMRVKRSFAEAKILRIVTPSSERISPECKYFGHCGGCRHQDLNYSAQLKFKEQQVAEAFEKLGGLSGYDSLQILGSENKYFYRNKMEFTFTEKRWLTEAEISSEGDIPDRDFALGLHVPRVFEKVIDIDSCLLQSELSSRIVNFTRSFFKDRGVTIYSTKTHTGFLRNLVIRQSGKTEDLMVNLVTNGENNGLMEAYKINLTGEFPEITTIVNSINTGKANVATGEYFNTFWGDGFIFDFIGDLKFRISPNSFFQTNTYQAENLYNQVVEFAEFDGSEIVYDLYCGAGTISQFLSRSVKSVYGFESVKAAISDAKLNADFNGISNCEFFIADLNKSFRNLASENLLPLPDVIVTDPPRGGMHKNTVDDILHFSPDKIVYVSCNPTTQARDLKILSESGYKIEKARPVDMFPHTYHIESVVLLIKS